MNSPNKQIKCSGCTRLRVCWRRRCMVSVLIRAVLCIEVLTSCSSELMYSTDSVSWNEMIALNRCACFFLAEQFCFCQYQQSAQEAWIGNAAGSCVVCTHTAVTALVFVPHVLNISAAYGYSRLCDFPPPLSVSISRLKVPSTVNSVR